QKLVGVGFVAMVYDRSGWYERTAQSDDPRAGFIFAGLDRHEPIGKFGLRYGGAVGVEIDRFDLELGSPPHALVVATSEGLGPGSLP
ncbi:N,N-dimethylformamidase beta subunit family domain-containing protein, partial [Acinetobacter baumannii]